MTSRKGIILAVGLALLLAACAAGSPDARQAAAAGPLTQLVLGFWHGLIAPITLIVEVIQKFFPGVLPIPQPWKMYEASASGVPYDIGFYFGLAGGPVFGYSRWR
jgi:hypothetical protein